VKDVKIDEADQLVNKVHRGCTSICRYHYRDRFSRGIATYHRLLAITYRIWDWMDDYRHNLPVAKETKSHDGNHEKP